MIKTHGSLFSGIGGFDLAAQWMGWENVFHCEKEKFCQRVLKHYWPNAKLYDDIKTTDFTPWHGKIDVLSGGFPCQPFSQAGKQQGTADDRYLWPEMLRAIRESRPRWIVGENVRGLVSWSEGMVFEQVHTDLEREGYEVGAYLLPACGVNAPHQRYRVWFVAHSGSRGVEKSNSLRQEQTGGAKFTGFSESRDAADTSGTGLARGGNDGIFTGPEHTGTKRFSAVGPFADANGLRQSSQEHGKAGPGFFTEKSRPNDWENWPTQYPVFSGNDGIPRRLDGVTFPKWRNESIKSFGNAVVPQLVVQIYRSIEQYENLNKVW